MGLDAETWRLAWWHFIGRGDRFGLLIGCMEWAGNLGHEHVWRYQVRFRLCATRWVVEDVCHFPAAAVEEDNRINSW